MSLRIYRCLSFATSVAVLAGFLAAQEPAAAKKGIGYSDTPLLPDSKWHVHDSARPQPPVVAPGTDSTATSPGKPPSDAIVLFDGKDLSQWTGQGGKAGWKVQDGYMEVNGSGEIATKEGFGDCQLHIEWAAPSEPVGESQGRGNSGVFLMGRYEVQVLDSFQNPTYADGQAASLYGQYPPMVNACRGPGEWQAYDIIFRAPRFEGDKVVQPALVTVLHNGVVVHHAAVLNGPSGHRNVPKYVFHGDREPIKLQDHGNPVRYRNIWIRRLRGYDAQ